MSKSFLDSGIAVFIRILSVVLALFLMAVVLLSGFELVMLFARQLANPPMWLIDLGEMRDLFTFFMTVVIGLVLLDAVRGLAEEQRLQGDKVLLAGLVAVVQNVLSADYASKALPLLAMAGMLLALAGGYYLVRRAEPAGERPKGGTKGRHWEGDP